MQADSHSILVVEDDEFMAALVRAMLERQQMRVSCVADGRAALERLDEGPVFDAVVLDLMLPQVSGLEVLAQLRQRAGWQDTPVLVLSAVDAGDEIARAFAAGASDYVVKPFNPEEFLARLARLLPRTGQGG